MGKNKEAGRSKTRPSSSSLAASLLPTGGSSVGFGGYLGGTRVEPPVSTIKEEVTSPFQVVDPELSQHLKRLGRKDSTTKLKALTALSKILSERNGEDIVRIIPLWAFEYKKLLNDYNRDVRRATNETMTSLVISVRRGLAPYLKSLIGPWWFSQFDQVFEISQAARRSFEAAFPAQEKRLDALIISCNEVFIYLDENFKLTPQTMSDKATAMDELEDMHQHVLSSSLLAMATLIHILAGEKTQAQTSEDATQEVKVVSKARVTGLSFAKKMFNDQKFFLEFLKSKSPRVRSATYSVLVSFVKHVPNSLDEGNSKLLSTAILGSLQEKDASCHSSMWDMILHFSQRYPDYWFLNNIQKNSLTRLWQFLRNECYGSQEISYPVLVLFLDSLPAKIVAQEHFLFNFLQSMWKGRNPFQSQATNPHIFFAAFKECFLWGLYKASSYVPVEEMPHFQRSLIDNILVKLLWGDYFSLVPVNLQHDHSFQKPNSSSEDAMCGSNQSKSAVQHSKKYPKSYLQNLGKCLVEILSNISSKDSTLLCAFCSTFQKDSLEVLHKGESIPRFSDFVERITNFFLMMNQLGVVKDQNWPLNDLAGPLVAKCLPLIKSLDSDNFVKLLVTMSDIFGPDIIVLNCFFSTKGQYCNEFIEESRRESSNLCFLQVFKEEIIPWCLYKLSHSTSLKLDLLISLLDDEHFFEQWNLIIEYATKPLNYSGNERCASYAQCVSMLATLLEKVRNILENKKVPINLKGQNGCLPEHWQHALLDMAAVSVLSHPSPFSASCGNFIRAAIGGSLENNQICFLSKEALVSIYEIVLRNLITFIAASSHSWALSATSLLLSHLSASGQNFMEKIVVSEIKHIEKAQFSIEVLDGSIFCLSNLHMDSKVLPCLLASLFLIEWGESLSAKVHVHDCFESSEYLLGVDTSIPIDEASDSQKKVDSTLFLGEKVLAVRSKMTVNLLQGFDSCDLMILRNILIHTVRTAIFETETPFKDRMPALCCNWMLDILQVICQNPGDEQNALDQLLSENEYWPIWVSPHCDGSSRSAIQASQISNIDNHKPRYDQFVAFVEKLITRLGVSKIVAGFSEHSTSCNAETTGRRLPSISYTRSWIAAELLCTWNWPGKCSSGSFLHLLNDYAKKSLSSFKESLIFSVVGILLDASILHGASSHMNFFNVWAASDDEVESIHDPYLRALISLLSALIVKDNTWKKFEASLLFEHVVDKLFVGTNINQSCLRVLPFVLNIISQPLIKENAKHDEASETFQHDYVNINSIRSNIVSWLQSALALPSLTFENTQNQDLEEWIQLIVSCYPLSAKGAVGSFNAAEIGYIDQLERTLLLSLFRKQRHEDDAADISIALSPSSSFGLEVSSPRSAQMMLVKLTAVSVAYCWQDFNDDDWDFALAQIDKWIKSLVLVMEEITEKVDDIVTNSNFHTEETMRRLKLAVQIFDPLQLSISKTALIILSLFSRIFSSNEVDANRVLPSILEKWDSRRDGISEDVLRLFFATGAAEAIASYVSKEASTIVAYSRHAYPNLWDLVATCVINSPQLIRSSSAQSMDLWGLSVGPVASLYALLFSCEPLSSLQLAAYNLLSTEPICQISLLKEDKNALSGQDSYTDHNSESSSEESCNLREEISSIIENPHPAIFEDNLLASHRVNYFIGWALMLSYLQSLPSSSKARERISLHVQDSVSSTILHCIFQHIPLKYGFSNNLKKKDVELPMEVTRAADSAKQAICTSSLSYAVESLWPVEADKMAVLAGSIYGSMIHLLPAYVRNWFTGLRDRAFTSSVESFTKTWCSPPLIADEFTQMKGEGLADDNFSVTVNKSAYEIIATYKKEDTGMDLVIRLPICYPLRPVDVACTRSLGISEVKQRKWLLSLNAFVRNQNGAIAEAMRTWKKNFDKEFQGVEECPICYSIIHTTNHSLPRLACKTCKHKFHSACLYKWFSTSNKSTCPLCQMPF